MNKKFIARALTLAGSLLLVQASWAQSEMQKKPEPPRSKEWKINSAMSAAPHAVGRDATVLDWPEKTGGKPVMLRQGRNGWTCFPDYPVSPGNDPMCMDKIAMPWMQAYMDGQKAPPKLSQPGISYMLQGGSDASNTDPFAAKPTSADKWMKAPPHLMIFPAGKLDTSAYGTDEHSGGPWVMWAGTPYEHLMVPVK